MFRLQRYNFSVKFAHYWQKKCNFAIVMDKILKVHTVNDYARYIGAPELYPLVSVIHYDELEHCRHSLNNYDVYALFIGDEELEELSYGQIRYTLSQHALMCVALGQIGGKTDTGEEIQHQRGPADVARTTAEHRRHPGTDSPGTAARGGRAHSAHRHLADRAGAGVRQPLNFQDRSAIS